MKQKGPNKFLATFLFILNLICGTSSFVCAEENVPVKVGWVGPITGPASSYQSYNAALLAVEDVNKSGGVSGRELVLIPEDGKCDGKTAVAALQKLINVDHIKYVLGGHCSPESIPMASIAEKNKVLMLAATTSSPALTNAGDYIFRVTPVSLVVGELQAKYAFEKQGAKTAAVINAETDYATPVAEKFKEIFTELGGTIVEQATFSQGETDFRTIVSRIRVKNPEAIYIGVQSADSGIMIMKQIAEQGLKVQVYGNEVVGNTIKMEPETVKLFEGVVFAESDYYSNPEKSDQFLNDFKKKFNNSNIPSIAAEAYDSVRLLAELISKCGDDVEKVKNCLYQVKDYKGSAGTITFDKNGDVIKKYLVRRIRNGKYENLKID